MSMTTREKLDVQYLVALMRRDARVWKAFFAGEAPIEMRDLEANAPRRIPGLGWLMTDSVPE
jgi:hypothetical protein